LISKILRLLASVFFNAMFSGSDNWARHSSIFIYVIEIYLVFKLIRMSVGYVLILFSVLLLLYLLSQSSYGFLYVLVVSTIPTIWYFLTSLPFTKSILQSFVISIRALTLSAWTLSAIYFTNPMEMAWILRHLFRNRGLQILFPLIWRVIPHIMKDMESSLLANELKGEKGWKALAVTMLATKEYEILYSEGLVSKIERFSPLYWYDKKALVFHICVLTLILLLMTLQ